MKKEVKKGQVTIFIILAIVIVAVGILFYMFYPEIRSTLGFGLENPNTFIQNCLGENIEDAVVVLSPQGGSLNPEFYYLYQDDKIEYLCYTNEYYKTCTVQQPMLRQHIENEIKENITVKVKECFDELESTFKARGYQVNLKRGDFMIELLPKRIIATFNNTLTLKKEDTEVYKQFNVVLNNNLYELIVIADNIISWETIYGDTDISRFMGFYPNLKVEKYKQGEGTTIYILTDRNKGNKFQFASRSIAWPTGKWEQR